MSAHAEPCNQGDGPIETADGPAETEAVPAEPESGRAPAATVRSVILGEPGWTRLAVPPVVLGLGTLAAYVFVSSALLGGTARFDLVSVPIFVAAAFLPLVSGLLVTGSAIAFAVWPIVSSWPTATFEATHLVEVLLIAIAALILRTSLTRAVTAEVDRAERDARSAERMRTVLGIAARVSRTFDRDEIFGTIVTEVTRAMGTDVATIRMVRDDDLVLTACAGIPEEAVARLGVRRRDEPWFVEMARTGRPSLSVPVRARQEEAGDPAHDGVLEYAADLVVPLDHHGAIVGTLATATRGPRVWSPEDIDFMTAVATHASIAMHNAELFEKSEAKAAQLAVLQAASARMNRQNSVESVGRAIVEETNRLLEYHNARVYLLEGDELVAIALEGVVGEYEKVDFDLLRTRVGVGLVGWVAQHDEPLLVPDARSDPRALTIPGTDDIDESMLVVPIRYDERVVGVVTLAKLGLHQFDEEDLRLLTILADQAATALESARILAHSQQLAAELRRLVDLNGELAHSLDPRQVADVTARHLAGVMGVERCTVNYWDRAEGRLDTLGSYPLSGPGEAGVPSCDLAGYPGIRRVLEEGATSVVGVDDPAIDRAEAELMRAEGYQTLTMLPLVANGATIGVVELLAERQVTYGAAHLECARTMANEGAMALENARLYADARALADHDQLTGFFNHRYLHERLGEEIIRAQRSRHPLTVLMIDLDDFKLVNDTFGHLFGDRVLAWSAELIRSTLRASDVPARYGGDEFAVILPETDAESGRRVSERILEAYRVNTFRSESHGPVPVGLSIGLATFPADGRTGQELIAVADRGLYRVKNAGGQAATRLPDGKAMVAPDHDLADAGLDLAEVG